jgi:hypothetical protein
MMPQGIANRDILAGHLNLHVFESTWFPACRGMVGPHRKNL